MALLTAAVTVLSLAGTPAKPYGDTTKPAVSDPRTYSGASTTRLGLTGVSAKPYGTFDKNASTSDAKTSATTEMPVVTIGAVSDVDLDTTQWMVPKVTLASTIAYGRTSSFSLIPKATMGPSSIASSSINKTPALTAVPVVTLANVVRKPVASAPSLIPVVTLASSVDTSFVQKTSAFTAIPQVTLASEVDSLVQSPTQSHSLIPKIGVATQVLRVSPTADRAAEFTAQPRVTLNLVIRESGDVDRIDIISRPMGRIQITPT